MKLPPGLSNFRLVRLENGTYTTLVTYDETKWTGKSVEDWIRIHGRILLEDQLGYSIESISDKQKAEYTG